MTKLLIDTPVFKVEFKLKYLTLIGGDSGTGKSYLVDCIRNYIQLQDNGQMYHVVDSVESLKQFISTAKGTAFVFYDKCEQDRNAGEIFSIIQTTLCDPFSKVYFIIMAKGKIPVFHSVTDFRDLQCKYDSRDRKVYFSLKEVF